MKKIIFFFEKKQLLSQNYSQGFISSSLIHYNEYNPNFVNRVSNRSTENIKRSLSLFDFEKKKEQKPKDSPSFDIFEWLP
jgi:hypothetical protein